MQFNVELRTINVMRVIEEEGSIAKAAESLYISQPALSKYIKRIEDQLSFPLYIREKGRCFPTEAGKVLLTEGKLLLNQYNSIIQKLEVAGHSTPQELSLGWPMGYTVQYLHKIMSGDDKSIKVSIKEDSVENLIQQLLDKKLSLLLVPALYSHPELIYKTLKREEFYLAVPKGHGANELITANNSELAELSKLAGEPFISLYAKAYREFVNPLFQEAGFSPNVIFNCNNWDSSHSLVENGLGLAIVPYWFADSGNDKVNYYRIKSNYHTFRTFAFAYLRNQEITQKIQTFMDKATLEFGDKFASEPFDYSFLSKRF